MMTILGRTVAACLAAICILYLLSRTNQSQGLNSVSDTFSSWHDSLHDVRNRTLGFSEILVLSLAERSDKRDALSLTASFSEIDLKFVDGVRGENVPKKAIPAGWHDGLSNSTLGCWRGHMEILQKIVNEKIPSALVLEDDADWDVMLKAQLVEFARGARYLQGSDDGSRTPYGGSWDFLWLGHCGAVNKIKRDHRYYVIENDPTVVPPQFRTHRNRVPIVSAPALAGEQTRLIFRPRRALCSTAYGITLRGAEKLLYYQTQTGNALAFDHALNNYCDQPNVFCATTFPTLFSNHLPAGDGSKDSDRMSREKALIRDEAVTENIMFSARVNLGRHMLSDNSTFRAQYPVQGILQEIWSDVELPRGIPKLVTADQYEAE